jgi:ATP-dependent RNA helicase RhlE
MPPVIANMSNTILIKPARIQITPVSSTVETIQQYLYYVDKVSKKDLLLHLLQDTSIESALIFTRTKHGADRVVRQLEKEKVRAQAIHGDKSQGARQLALSNFKNKSLRILVATDIAARGIDIDELSHVINYDVPSEPETYVHRIGRTGRAGLSGVAITFCDFDEKAQLAEVEALIRKRIPEVKDHPFPLINNFPAVKVVQPRRKTTQSDSFLMTSTIKDSKHSASRRKGSQQADSSEKKKMRMTADGTLKEKKSKFRTTWTGNKGSSSKGK